MVSLNTEARYDTLTLYDGPAATSTALATLSGSLATGTVRRVYQGHAAEMLLEFHSDGSVSGTGGFELHYQCARSAGQGQGPTDTDCTPVRLGSHPAEGVVTDTAPIKYFCLRGSLGTTYDITVNLGSMTDSGARLHAAVSQRLSRFPPDFAPPDNPLYPALELPFPGFLYTSVNVALLPTRLPCCLSRDSNAWPLSISRALCTVLDVYAASDLRTALAHNDDANGGLASYVEWTAPATGMFFIAVRSFRPTSPGDFTLTVNQLTDGGGGGDASHTDSPCLRSDGTGGSTISRVGAAVAPHTSTCGRALSSKRAVACTTRSALLIWSMLPVRYQANGAISFASETCSDNCNCQWTLHCHTGQVRPAISTL